MVHIQWLNISGIRLVNRATVIEKIRLAIA